MNCQFCSTPLKEKITFKNLFSSQKNNILCKDCKQNLYLKTTMIGNYPLYYFASYSFLRETIYAIKYFGDIEKALIFKPLFTTFFKEHHFDLITVVPSNFIRETIRGFNQVEIICSLCDVKYTPTLFCNFREKQAKIHEKRIKHNFFLLDNLKMKNNIKKILIIDDVYTSGQTLLSCSLTLKEHFQNSELFFLTLANSNEK